MRRPLITISWTIAAVLALTSAAEAGPRRYDRDLDKRARTQRVDRDHDHFDRQRERDRYRVRAERPRRHRRQAERGFYAGDAILAGDLVTARWGGSWWDAEVRATHRNLVLVHYVGYSSAWDEWVPRARVRPRIVVARDLEVLPRVEILWGGNWYDGVVRERRGDLVRVHYVGWSDSWDEWVGPDRVRFVEAPAMRRHDQRRTGLSDGSYRPVSYRY